VLLIFQKLSGELVDQKPIVEDVVKLSEMLLFGLVIRPNEV